MTENANLVVVVQDVAVAGEHVRPRVGGAAQAGAHAGVHVRQLAQVLLYLRRLCVCELR